MRRISPLALIGDPPESRDHHGPGIPPDIHVDARVEAFASIDAGTQRPTRFGASWAFKHSHIGHDAIVGDGCEIATGAIVGGWCEIGDNVRIGLGAVIRPRVKVGDGARVGMGAIVTKDVPPDVTVIGNPAHDIEHNPSVDEQWYEWYSSRDKIRPEKRGRWNPDREGIYAEKRPEPEPPTPDLVGHGQS